MIGPFETAHQNFLIHKTQIMDKALTVIDGTSAVIADLFASEIKVGKVGVDDNFFDLGGDSLAAENLILAVQKRFGVDLQTSALLEAPTPRELGEMIVRARRAHSARSLVVPVSSGTDREPLAMIHGMSGSALFASRFSVRLRQRFSLLAVRGMGLESGELPCEELEGIVDNYFEGLGEMAGRAPRFVGGLCLGGLLAVEVGRRTYAQTGERPALVLIDPPPRGSAWLRPEKDNRMTQRRQRQMARQAKFWSWLRDVCVRLDLGQSLLGRKARREAFKKTLTRAVAGFSPAPFPCDVLVIASSEWGAQTIGDYKAWATEEMNLHVVTLPGRHNGFRQANMNAIEDAIVGFLEQRKAPA